MQYFVVLISIV